VDLDFFTLHAFDSVELFEQIRESFTVTDASPAVNSLSLFVAMNDERIKIDLLRHNYPLLCPVRIIEDVPLYSLEDIAAMKLNAIANRGAKKDFYDIHALLKYFTLQDLLRFFQQKYEQMNSLTVVKSLVYFEDADQEPDPLSLENASWPDIKNELVQQIQKLC
jgi:predicted nucleotidyltransferase component of viral defense system